MTRTSTHTKTRTRVWILARITSLGGGMGIGDVFTNLDLAKQSAIGQGLVPPDIEWLEFKDSAGEVDACSSEASNLPGTVRILRKTVVE